MGIILQSFYLEKSLKLEFLIRTSMSLYPPVILYVSMFCNLLGYNTQIALLSFFLHRMTMHTIKQIRNYFIRRVMKKPFSGLLKNIPVPPKHGHYSPGKSKQPYKNYPKQGSLDCHRFG
jgi:hypothetical protein